MSPERIALHILCAWYCGDAGYSATVVDCVRGWVAAGMPGDVPWPACPFFDEWAERQGYVNRGGFIRPLAEAAEPPRPETGPMQFGDDWPGVFIRGDNAMWYGVTLAALLRRCGDEDPLGAATLAGLADLLQSCDARANPRAQIAPGERA